MDLHTVYCIEGYVLIYSLWHWCFMGVKLSTMRVRVNVELYLLKCSFGEICITCRQCSSPFAAVKGRYILPANCGQLCSLGVAKRVEQVVWADGGRKFSKATLYSAVTPLMYV